MGRCWTKNETGIRLNDDKNVLWCRCFFSGISLSFADRLLRSRFRENQTFNLFFFLDFRSLCVRNKKAGLLGTAYIYATWKVPCNLFFSVLIFLTVLPTFFPLLFEGVFLNIPLWTVSVWCERLPTMHCDSNQYIKIFVTSSFCSDAWTSQSNMAKCVVRNSRLSQLRYVSKDD